VPEVHIAFGNPGARLRVGSQTGADCTCTTHIDAITRDCDVWAGGEQIMAGAGSSSERAFDPPGRRG
jgi:hypothetical protein